MRQKFLALLMVVLLASCAPAGQQPQPRVDRLAPFEQGDWPPAFAALPLDPARSYVVLAQIPSPVPFDLSSPAAAQAAFRRLAREPWRILRAGTALGHVMIGWSCADGHRGLTSKTGGNDGRIAAMLDAGWGLSAAFATYLDGELIPLEDFPPAHAAILAEGRGHLLAAEVSAADCDALRRTLDLYLAHPAAPATRYGLIGPVEDMQGDGCIGLALFLACKGGMFSGLIPALTRRVPLNDSFMGTGTAVPAGVIPFRPVGPDGTPPGPVSRDDLLSRDWAEGRPLGHIDVPDVELLFAGLTALREAGGLPSDWHARRALPATDPQVARARAAMLDWARGWPVWRVGRRGPLYTLVLERGSRD